MAERVRWGVIGSGGIARRRTIPEGIAAAPNAMLAAVFDVDGEANRAVAAQFGGHPMAAGFSIDVEKIPRQWLPPARSTCGR